MNPRNEPDTHGKNPEGAFLAPGSTVFIAGGNDRNAAAICANYRWTCVATPEDASMIMAHGTSIEVMHIAKEFHHDTRPLLLLITRIDEHLPGVHQEMPGGRIIDAWSQTSHGILLATRPVIQMQSDLDRMQQQITHLHQRLTELYSSNRYRAGDLIANAWPPSVETLKLPFRLLQLFRDRTLGGSLDEGIQTSIPSLSGNKWQMRRAEKAFRSFREHVAARRAKQVVFIFSGTTYIQDIKGNRPIRLAQAYLARGIPVIFSYHRWKASESPAWSDDPNLLQLPVDLALRLMRDIAAERFDNAERLFIVGYPLPLVLRHINRFTTNGWLTLYDCRDDWEEFWKSGQASWYQEAAEAYVVRNVDAACCVSNALVNKMKAFCTDQLVTLSPNAHDETLSHVQRLKPASDQRIFGYVGHLASAWFDWDLLVSAAKTLPECRFELIGHSAPTNLELPENITLHDARPMQHVGKLAANWAAALIPFKPGALSNGVDPIKVYEYLAMGLPVIASGVSQVRDYPGVAFAETADAFIASLQNPPGLPAENDIQAFLSRNTWAVRTEELFNLAQRGATGNAVHGLEARQGDNEEPER